MSLYVTTYPEGQIVTVQGTYKTVAGVLSDPTTVLLTVVTPDRNSVTYQYGVGAQIVKTSTGIYTSDLDTTNKRGLWIYTWWSTGNIQADSGEQEFYVE